METEKTGPRERLDDALSDVVFLQVITLCILSRKNTELAIKLCKVRIDKEQDPIGLLISTLTIAVLEAIRDGEAEWPDIPEEFVAGLDQDVKNKTGMGLDHLLDATEDLCVDKTLRVDYVWTAKNGEQVMVVREMEMEAWGSAYYTAYGKTAAVDEFTASIEKEFPYNPYFTEVVKRRSQDGMTEVIIKRAMSSD